MRSLTSGIVTIYKSLISWCNDPIKPMSSWIPPSLVEYFFLSAFLRFLLDLVLDDEALV